MLTEKISSKENNIIKQFVKLSNSKQQRKAEMLFTAEGIKIILEAAQSGYAIKTLLYTQQASEKHSTDLSNLSPQAESCYLITDDISKKISDTQTPQGVFAIITMLDNKPNTAKISNNGCYILLNSLQDPGNIGTIIRTSAAFGIDGLFLSDDCPDIYSPKILRATMGGVFKQPIFVADDMPELIKKLQCNSIIVYASNLDKKSHLLTDINLGKGTAVVIGNEGNGLPQNIIDICDKSVIIPMQSNTESLNAATAATIFMYEMSRGS